MKLVEIYTDGACSGNPGPGGWGAILKYGDIEKEISGYEENTTNNRMELIAAIEALKLLKRPCRVHLYSDSAYLVNAFNNNWVQQWNKNGWINAKRDEVKNKGLWQQLLELSRIHEITWIKVKGHSDNEYNNRCDRLANAEIEKHREQAQKQNQ